MKRERAAFRKGLFMGLLIGGAFWIISIWTVYRIALNFRQVSITLVQVASIQRDVSEINLRLFEQVSRHMIPTSKFKEDLND